MLHFIFGCAKCYYADGNYDEDHNAVCHYVECHCAEGHYAECHCAECHYAECHYAECHCAECHYTECRYAECRGANVKVTYKDFFGKLEHFINVSNICLIGVKRSSLH